MPTATSADPSSKPRPSASAARNLRPADAGRRRGDQVEQVERARFRERVMASLAGSSVSSTRVADRPGSSTRTQAVPCPEQQQRGRRHSAGRRSRRSSTLSSSTRCSRPKRVRPIATGGHGPIYRSGRALEVRRIPKNWRAFGAARIADHRRPAERQASGASALPRGVDLATRRVIQSTELIYDPFARPCRAAPRSGTSGTGWSAALPGNLRGVRSRPLALRRCCRLRRGAAAPEARQHPDVSESPRCNHRS